MLLVRMRANVHLIIVHIAPWHIRAISNILHKFVNGQTIGRVGCTNNEWLVVTLSTPVRSNDARVPGTIVRLTGNHAMLVLIQVNQIRLTFECASYA